MTPNEMERLADRLEDQAHPDLKTVWLLRGLADALTHKPWVDPCVAETEDYTRGWTAVHDDRQRRDEWIAGMEDAHELAEALRVDR